MMPKLGDVANTFDDVMKAPQKKVTKVTICTKDCNHCVTVSQWRSAWESNKC